jgi:predicted alpha-1,6-mannanase (GH76 family)
MRAAAFSTADRRGARLAVLLVAGSLACTPLGRSIAHPASSAPSSAAAGRAAEARRRADAALDALVARWWRPATAWSAAGAGAGPADYWLSAVALDAVLDGVERNGPRDAALVAEFYDAQERRGWRRDWFDDECWMALALLRAHDLLGDPRYLARAVSLAQDVATSAADAGCCGDAPGGLWWDRAHTQKATAANAGAALLAARLWERTGEARWLAFARGTYAWWRAHMVDAASGRVADHLDRSGAKVWWTFTYDAGLMVGAAVALHRATGEEAYLDDARRMAAFVVAAETRPTPLGDVLSDGPSCAGDCHAFKGIAHRYLSALAAVDPRVPGLAPLLAADAAALWTLARDPRTGSFAVDWGGPPSAPSFAADCAAATALARDAAREPDPVARAAAPR